MKTPTVIMAASCLLFTVFPVSGQENPFKVTGAYPPSDIVMGRQAKIDLVSGKLEGELLSVTGDSLWVFLDGSVSGVPLGDVRKVSVRMHKWGSNRMLAWNLIAGLGSAVAMTAACSTVEDVSGGCGTVFASWSLGWALVGGLAGIALHSSSKRELPPYEGALQPYVRFPQGLPRAHSLGNGTGRSGG